MALVKLVTKGCYFLFFHHFHTFEWPDIVKNTAEMFFLL